MRPYSVRIGGTGATKTNDRESTMNDAADKMKHKGEELGGKAKEAAGKLTNDDDLEAEGRADQTSANLKQAGDNVKDAFTN